MLVSRLESIPRSDYAVWAHKPPRQIKKFGEIVYRCAAMEMICNKIRKTLDNDITVLIQGETGTGKELVAQAIHRFGARGSQPFYCQNTAALTDTLLESEMFGHRRGSFSGAHEDKVGFFEYADGGTVFLDEIGEASLAFQVRMLRLLETGTFRRVGESKERKTRVRIIAATNRDLMEEVRLGRFREDLYYRLCVFPIEIPPLRERSEDIPILADVFAREISKTLGCPYQGIGPGMMRRFRSHDWPGNVRELKNTVNRILVAGADEDFVFPEAAQRPVLHAVADRSGEKDIKTLEEVQREYILFVLKTLNGNQSEAARKLGMNRNTFRARMKKLRIPADPERRTGFGVLGG